MLLTLISLKGGNVVVDIVVLLFVNPMVVLNVHTVVWINH